MKKEAVKDYLIINGQINKVLYTDIFDYIEKPSIYEVIRIIDGIPLFLEEHLDRMEKSADLVDYTIPRTKKSIKKDIKKLIKINNIDNLNIKLLSTHIEEKGKVFLVYFIESYYPQKSVYENGVHTILCYHERENPNAKIHHTEFKENTRRKLEKEKAFEALLVNRDGYIIEGSRSNIFFVKQDKIYTSPAGEVLLGITRKRIFEVCNKLNLKIIEENLHIEDLEKIQGAFMTGTSINVLPITTIEDKRIDSVKNPIIKKVSFGYIEEMRRYINTNKTRWK